VPKFPGVIDVPMMTDETIAFIEDSGALARQDRRRRLWARNHTPWAGNHKTL
jgi:hypothetical protein